MLFNSFDFLVFFVVVFLVQLVLPHQVRNRFLLAASCYFYACWDWRFLGLMACSTGIGYFCSHRIEYSHNPSERRIFLTASVVANLAILGFFKYFSFFSESLQQLAQTAGWELGKFSLHVVLPVGISFYTFQIISYTVDVYRGISNGWAV